ncbi:MAG: flagellar hook protein FlgE [Phycisphaerae bacterium]
MGSLLTGVSGLKSHQQMLDVAGNNLSNVNTLAYKTGRVTFADLLSQTLKGAMGPSDALGGSNPQQIGSGVEIGSIDRDTTQGQMEDTGQDLDLAIEGEGYFVVDDGERNLYTRAGSFEVDSDNNLVDPSTGYRVQRIGSTGVSEGFQSSTSDAIRVPYDTSLPANATANISYTGNLSADESDPTTNQLSSTISFTTGGGSEASASTLIADLDQADSLADGDTITITGAERDGSSVNATVVLDTATTDMQDLLDALNAEFTDSTAELNNGKLVLTDDEAGYSQTDLNLSYSGAGTLELPAYFELDEAGGEAVKESSVEIYDTQGVSHVLSAAFVKTDTANTWDMVVTNVTGDIDAIDDRRVEGITFSPDNGSFSGLTGDDSSSIQMTFGHDPGNVRTISLDLGSVGEHDGLTQFGGDSTVFPSSQDGYEAGWLSELSVTREGVLSGVFTNGVRRDIAALRLATFQNPAALQSVGNNYYEPSANSGEPVPTTAQSAGAGSVRGGSLEKSNVDVSTEFVNLIQAQNGFQANARTITVTNDMLRELTSLIR